MTITAESQGLAAYLRAVGARKGPATGAGPGAHLPRGVLAWPGEPTQATGRPRSPPGPLTGRGVCPALALTGASEPPMSAPEA